MANLSHCSIITRSVWYFNVETEFELIRSTIATHPIISMDTEFPGVVFQSHPALRLPENNYDVLKTNVDRMHLIQLGLTLSDCDGNLLTFETSNSFIWEFNFCDFNLGYHLYAPDSIELLSRQGIDFEKNSRFGVHTLHFAELLMYSKLVCNNHVQWITFHGTYDIAYLVKALTRQYLPYNMCDFLHLVNVFFGNKVYDVKYLIKFCPKFYGGLDRVCQSLNLDRAVGKNHQAGSKNLSTMQVFKKIKDMYFQKENNNNIVKFANVLYDLEVV